MKIICLCYIEYLYPFVDFIVNFSLNLSFPNLFMGFWNNFSKNIGEIDLVSYGSNIVILSVLLSTSSIYSINSFGGIIYLPLTDSHFKLDYDYKNPLIY